MQTGKKINQISNRLRRRSRAIQETIGISGAQGNILNYNFSRISEQICLSEGY